MNVSRNVIHDLVPLYLADEASADTRALIEEFLAADPELAGEVAVEFYKSNPNRRQRHVITARPRNTNPGPHPQ